MKTITFINEKGGIGKTSVCFNLAWEIAKNKRVLMIDLDGQRANLTFFCGVKSRRLSICEAMLEECELNEVVDVAKECIVEVKDNLHIIPAKSTVSTLTAETAKIGRLQMIIEGVSSDYDYCFIDVSPSPCWRHYLSLSVSDYVIVPMLPDIASLEAYNGIAGTIKDIKEHANTKLKVLGIVFNKNNERTNMSKEVKTATEMIAKRLDTKIFESRIRNAVPMGELVCRHIGITDYDSKSNVADDIRNLVKEIEREVNNG